ncbi:MAG TPA: chemotaxis protein CheW [Stellaceae bacterium]|nr:chemotaxis protein CheW [Stellaceae bacterium]
MPLLLCRIADLHCAIPGARVSEVMRAPAIEPLAGMPAFVLGLSIIRGMPVPVIDAHSLLNAAASRAAYVIVLDVGGRAVALAVDEIIGLRRIAGDALAPLPPLLRNVANDAVAAIRVCDGELLLLLDTARLVPAHLLAALNAAGVRR